MNGIVAYFLLYMSTAFYCGFDTAIKDRLSPFANDTVLPMSFFSFRAKVNPSFDFQCEAFSCLTKILKLFNEKGEIIEDGWISAIGMLSGYDVIMIDDLKKKLNKCVPEVNQKLSNSTLTKCDKYRMGFQLLNECDEKIIENKTELANKTVPLNQTHLGP